MRNKKVVVGLSGGVDSAVAAYLLKKDGYDVTAIFMKNWDETDENGICTAEEDYKEAVKVANKLDIPYYSINFEKEYKERVFSYFLNEYKRGRTPNPDIMCNKEIKFKAFLDFAFKLGVDYLATGHYARIGTDDNGNKLLLRGLDNNKDQSYFLSQLNNDQIKNVLFPIGELTKSEVRQIASNIELPNANRKDSTGICFIGERNFNEFLAQFLKPTPGDMVNEDGKVIGKHNGLIFHTIGQRKGLGIGGDGEAWFVYGKDLSKNELLICQGENNPKLYSNRLIGSGFQSPCKDFIRRDFSCTAKFRYRQKDIPVEVHFLEDDRVELVYDDVKAVTPGQAAVLYDGEVCLGGFTIDEVYRDEERLLL
ncbi:MAG: tRNA 2-thiouridine(34) synthase MnmA [Firmicutes bacterium]|nr:tRNA 2-thiouridine(34) synthase MnmA [Ezakiella sp.]MDD7761220.1 tRNA 2-thiouridine(34) synthase MnmA [Bacillota bacterium]